VQPGHLEIRDHPDQSDLLDRVASSDIQDQSETLGQLDSRDKPDLRDRPDTPARPDTRGLPDWPELLVRLVLRVTKVRLVLLEALESRGRKVTVVLSAHPADLDSVVSLDRRDHQVQPGLPAQPESKARPDQPVLPERPDQSDSVELQAMPATRVPVGPWVSREPVELLERKERSVRWVQRAVLEVRAALVRPEHRVS